MRDTFQEQLIQARRNLIIDAAIEVISEQGFQRTTIKQIASKAGIADGTIYNYFKNKDGILTAIIARLSEGEAEDVNAAEAEQVDFETFISTFVSNRMAEMDSSFQTLKVVLPEMIMDADLSTQVYEQIYAPMFSVMEQYFEELIALGQIDAVDPALAARLFASPLLGMMMLRLLDDEHVATNWALYTEALPEFLLKALHKDEKSAE
ncbi:MAG: TetR/AcrR family transcriptional regulator [Anaerolineae bacterium]|nr:TetR/AcrR family transcriptional regulator [Anaerolineae bacterium]